MRALRRKGTKWLAALMTALLIWGAADVGPVLSRASALAEEEFVEPELTPTPAAAPTPAPLQEATPDPSVESTVEAAVEATPEPVDELPPMPEPANTPAPEPVPEVTPEPEAEDAPEANLEPDMAEETTPGSDDTIEPETAEEEQPAVEDEGMSIEPIYQGDYRGTICKVRGRSRSVATSGCGAVCVSMVISYLTGEEDQTPDKLFRRAVRKGEYSGSGLSHETLSALLEENGVQSEWISNKADGIIAALEEGKPVVAHMGPGTFTNAGHYLVLRGITEDGKILLNDPASPERTAEAYSIKTLINQARRPDSFMVCWAEESEEKAEKESKPKSTAKAKATDKPEATATARPEPTAEPEPAETDAPVPALIAAAIALREAE